MGVGKHAVRTSSYTELLTEITDPDGSPGVSIPGSVGIAWTNHLLYRGPQMTWSPDILKNYTWKELHDNYHRHTCHICGRLPSLHDHHSATSLRFPNGYTTAAPQVEGGGEISGRGFVRLVLKNLQRCKTPCMCGINSFLNYEDGWLPRAGWLQCPRIGMEKL